MITEERRLCKACGEMVPVSGFYPSAPFKKCKRCREAYKRAWLRENPHRWLYLSAKHNARKRGLAYELTEGWFVKRLAAGRCELTGIPFAGIGDGDPYAPSPDRIDNELGYTQENTRLVLRWINMAKHAMPETVFRKCLTDLAKAMHEQARAV